MKQEYETFMSITPCNVCQGMRLKKAALAVTVCDRNIYEVTSMSIRNLKEYLDNMQLTKQQELIGKQILEGNQGEGRFPGGCGTGIPVPVRATGTLSGGEAQRIRLATQIGSGW